MIGLLQRRTLRFLHPILKRLVKVYLSKPRIYKYQDITLTIMPGVFHPGLFYSTVLFVKFLSQKELQGKRILELGAGSGLISIFCAKQKAVVTSTDINEVALSALKKNADGNNVSLTVKYADLLEGLDIASYQMILINPPYYPQTPANIEEHAWYCGQDFEYFRKLFAQLGSVDLRETVIYMVLSEDCDLEKIKDIGARENFECELAFSQKTGGEMGYIFAFKRS